MPKINYIWKDFRPETRAVIHDANGIIDEYRKQGFLLTLRQLYYQFVARGLLKNTQREYKRLGGIVNDARLAGLLDWSAIEDRTRNLKRDAEWSDPGSVIDSAAEGYRIDKWLGQDHRVEVWIEKEALAGVFARVCREEQVPFFACRGYTSQSEMWRAARRLQRWSSQGYRPIILHFGDHDPSGIDMTRDIVDRMDVFRCDLKVNRLALNMDQVDEFNPPPNPAKVTDSRFEAYLQSYGSSSWELDALEPSVLAALVRDEIRRVRDADLWDERTDQEDEERELLYKLSRQWEDVAETLS